MSAKKQRSSILTAILGFVAVIVIVAAIGYFTAFGGDNIMGEVEAAEYRVTGKAPGRILDLRVEEGDVVHKGDTLAILGTPEESAKKVTPESTSDITSVISENDGEVSEVFARVGEQVDEGSPIMTVAITDDLWGIFDVREDMLQGMKVGDEITVYSPAFDKDIRMKVSDINNLDSLPAGKESKQTGRYGQKKYEMKARPVDTAEGLRPGMSLIIRR